LNNPFTANSFHSRPIVLIRRGVIGLIAPLHSSSLLLLANLLANLGTGSVGANGRNGLGAIDPVSLTGDPG
jgi:hypothetical protein